ncbi:hypothetical protein AVEN_222869-1 [Araneus ventricosus]|uniref:Uncharacterized protein n=1 Tax=Araneus ventricosus TaxID=182803 RepID=A0A4Y2T894_ARAVE|nr:hypothetical protein AVEN_222869-1 [Araneus ventricosus]
MISISLQEVVQMMLIFLLEVKRVIPDDLPFALRGHSRRCSIFIARGQGVIPDDAQFSLQEVTTDDTPFSLQEVIPDDAPFSSQEDKGVIKLLPSGTAPGIHGTDNLVLKTINTSLPDLLLNFFNKCLSFSTFPDARQYNILSQNRKTSKFSSSYRSIALFYRLWEKLLKIINTEINSFSGKQ